MNRLLRSERGFSLPEVLLVSTLWIVVLGATLQSFTGFERRSGDNRRFSEQADKARRGLDRAARQLRNLARRVEQDTIRVALPYDFVFQTSDPAKTWVRYCLDSSSAGATRDNARLWSAENPTADVSSTMLGPCPGTGWARTNLVVDRVANLANGKDRPLFRYACGPGAAPSCPNGASSVDFPKIKGVASEIFVDMNPKRAPTEMRVSTSVFLRNQNENPTASFTWKPSGPRTVVLNASASSDPEGRTLRYFWFKGDPPAFRCDQGPPATPEYFQGVTLTYQFPSSEGAAGSARPFSLVVCDPGDLRASFGPVAVTIP